MVQTLPESTTQHCTSLRGSQNQEEKGRQMNVCILTFNRICNKCLIVSSCSLIGSNNAKITALVDPMCIFVDMFVNGGMYILCNTIIQISSVDKNFVCLYILCVY